jgi:concanavalin A-like lectin/glucanase superfamily protein
MRRMLLTFLLGVLLFGTAATAQATLLYPNLKTLPPRNLKFDYTDISVDGSGVLHHVLRFSNTAYNVGEGPLEIRATIDMSLNPPSGPAYQRVYDSNGGYTDIALTGSTLYYHAVHKHYHFDNWGGYELWTKAAYDNYVATGIGSPDLVGTKTTSCVEDEEFVSPISNAIWPAQYPSSKCMPNAQNVIAEGLSPGWGDTYDYYRFEQWIDLGPTSSLPDGTYVLRSIADPQNIVYESPNKSDSSRESQQDNQGVTVFSVKNGALVDSNPPSGTVTINHVDTTTSSPNVSLDILGRDDVSGVDQFQVSNDGQNWATYSNTSYDSIVQTISWDLTNATYGGTTASGIKTVYVKFHDKAGNWGQPVTDTIDYEPVSPPSTQTSAYGKAVQADGPVSWWRLGEKSGTTAADAAGTNPGTYAGGYTLGSPSLLSADTGNNAVAFDGTSGRVSIPNSTALQLANNFSLEAWIKPAAIPASGSFASVLTKAESYTLQFNGPQLEFTVIQSGTRHRCKAPAGAIQVGNTYYVVGTYDGTTQRLYINGQQAVSCALTGNATATTNALYVGAWSSSVEFFKGVIDEPAVYNKVLTPTQIANHYSTANAATLTAPVGFTATAVSTSEIDLAWTNTSSGESNEVVERSTDPSFSSVTSFTLPGGTTSYKDTGLPASSTYYYRVKATTSTASSPYSPTMQATTLTPPSYAGTILADHPTSYWRLDETSGTVAGDQTVANPGTFVNTILGVPGLIASDPSNTAIGFNGSSSDIRVGQSGTLNYTSALTIEGWIQPTTLPATGTRVAILAKTGSYALELNGAQLELTVVQLGNRMTLDAPAGTIVAGRRYYVAGTWDGTTMRLYVNATPVASGALGGSADQTLNGLHIGSWDGASEFFNGTIDEPAIWGSALSASQITAHYNMAKPALGTPDGLVATAASSSQINLTWNDNSSGETGQMLQRSTDSSFSSPTSISLPADAQSYSDTGLSGSTTYYYRVKAITSTDSSGWSNTASATTAAPPAYAATIAGDNPVSWWRLDESSGQVAADQQGLNPGTYRTGTSLKAASLLPMDPTDTAVAFDGAKGNVYVPHTTSIDFTNAFTLETWIKPNAIPAAGTFNSIMTHPEAYSLQFNGPQLEFTVIQSGTRRRCQAPAGAIVAGNTYHVVGTFDGTTQRLYINGQLVASKATAGSASVTTYGLYLGSWNGSIEFFNGTIDEPAIYNSVLTSTQVARHYQAGTTG